MCLRFQFIEIIVSGALDVSARRMRDHTHPRELDLWFLGYLLNYFEIIFVIINDFECLKKF